MFCLIELLLILHFHTNYLFLCLTFAVNTFIFLLFLAYATSVCTEEVDNHNEQLMPCLTTCRTNDNFVISSVSLKAAMALAYFASTNDTREELKNILNIGYTGAVDDQFDKLQEGYVNQNDSKSPRMDSTIFYNKELKMEDHVPNETFLFTKRKSINFRKTKNAINQINSVIENETHNQIKNFVTDEMINKETSIFLENSFYFNAEWLKPFNKRYTDYRDFYVDGKKKKKVKSMVQTGKFHFRFLDEFNATSIELPFKDDSAMVILLPGSESKSALTDLQNLLINRQLINIRHFTRNEYDPAEPRYRIQLQLPVFKLETLRTPVGDMLKEVKLFF